MRGPRPNYDRKLAQPLALDNGMKLTTLADARTAVLYVFGSVDARTGELDHAIHLLLAAAQTGKREDIAAATEQVEIVLRGWRQL